LLRKLQKGSGMAQISSSRWANVNLDRQTEHEAAIATVKFLEKVRDTLSEGDFSTNKTLLTIPTYKKRPEKLQSDSSSLLSSAINDAFP
jgi:hypothetical protein